MLHNMLHMGWSLPWEVVMLPTKRFQWHCPAYTCHPSIRLCGSSVRTQAGCGITPTLSRATSARAASLSSVSSPTVCCRRAAAAAASAPWASCH